MRSSVHLFRAWLLIEINVHSRPLNLMVVREKGTRMPTDRYIRWFSETRLSDVGLVGGKNASLGELYSALSKEGVRVPNGFALTADAYRDALTAAKAWDPLHQLLDAFDKRKIALLAKLAAEARELVYRATGSEALRQAGHSRLSEAGGGIRSVCSCRRSQLGHRGGFAVGELCRPARELSECARRRRRVRGLPPLLCFDLHRSCDLLSHRQSDSTISRLVSRSA